MREPEPTSAKQRSMERNGGGNQEKSFLQNKNRVSDAHGCIIVRVVPTNEVETLSKSSNVLKSKNYV
ncbi:hypothetical protein RJT34_24670 [Clitoria ternatea]|uniref:Uncharacterized protein n=1 Tax=Clitoria ternatea TaxID=43366 RepID=A0AAN9FUK1_CLITE